MFRFSRDKRFFNYVTFREFMDLSNTLCALVRAKRPTASVEVLTYQASQRQEKYARVIYDGKSGTDNDQYFSYSLEAFTEDTWKRAVDVQLTIKDEGDEPFMICMSCSRRPVMRNVFFYGQCVDESLFADIYNALAQPDAQNSIGTNVNENSNIELVKAKRVA